MPASAVEIPVLLATTGRAARIILERGWMEQGSCNGSNKDAFFANKVPKPLKQLCASCPVQQECLEFTLIHSNTGYWAGTSERFRRTIRVYWLELHRTNGTYPPLNHNIYGRRLRPTDKKILAMLFRPSDHRLVNAQAVIAAPTRLGISQTAYKKSLAWLQKAKLVEVLGTEPSKQEQQGATQNNTIILYSVGLTQSAVDLIVSDPSTIRP